MKKLLAISIFALGLFANSLDINTFKADFKQVITNELDEKIVYTGSLSVKKPSLALWRYKKPIAKDVYLYDNRVYIVEPDLEQVTISTLSNSINFIDILSQAKKISDDTYKTKLNDIDALLIVKNNQISKLQYTDSMANRVEILFDNQSKNSNIPNHYFKFSIPDGYDIID
jgi:outer membrane lipoprotein carrier protein